MLTAPLNLDSLINSLDSKLIASRSRPLNSPEIMILRGIWQYRTYNQIALEEDYSPGYFTNVVAPELYKRMSHLIGKRVTKKNCRALLESYFAAEIRRKKNIDQRKVGGFSC